MYNGIVLDFLNMGGGEIMIIMVVVLLLFGGKKLPELARGLGKGLRDFKDASDGVKREIHRNINSVDIVDDVKSSLNDEPSTTGTTDTDGSQDQTYPSTLEEQYYGHAATDSTTIPDQANDVPDAQDDIIKGSQKETTNT